MCFEMFFLYIVKLLARILIDLFGGNPEASLGITDGAVGKKRQ